ncbi:VWA domain-containing protein [Streptomyces sp. NBC_00873]|uniref:VWA domain-containing protein n=1 Tax=unclassified Streptomyces TaxID=2593676 RepID=UPI0038656162|nr:VWA domain-containing protein [Streptomyces sp. NBC_00873]WTA42201.1 VWA domain-containing protein [Streptomyces sp. NBC_00842]
MFTIGTRLTREMTHRDPDTAPAAVAAAVFDRSGGTRLGGTPGAFLDTGGRRATARGTVVGVLSDGRERGYPALLVDRMRRLHRPAHRVARSNPRRAGPGYEPRAAGMAAALPRVNAFVEGNSLQALEQLAAVVGGAAPAGGERHA